MRSAFFASSFTIASSILAAGCADAATSEATTASAGAESTAERPHTFVCLEPTDHVRNGNGEVWVVDITSGFGPPIEKKIVRSTGFYWHGLLSDLVGPEAASWSISYTNEVDGMQVLAASDAGRVEVDYTGDPLTLSTVTGTVHVTPTRGAEETVSIGAGRRCPSAP